MITLSMSRTTPGSPDLMPEMLELLRREKEMKKHDVAVHMRDWIKKNRFTHRDRSIGWAKQAREREDVSHPGRGTWRITEKGLASTLTLRDSKEIVERWTQRERSARSANRDGRQPKR